MGYKVASVYPGSKTLPDFLTADAAYIAGVFVDLGNITMGALQSLQIGRGTHTGQQSAIGRIWGEFTDTSATPVLLKGRVRLQVYDPNAVPVANGLLLDERTEAIAPSSTNQRPDALPLPLRGSKIPPNYSLHLLFMADAAPAGSGTIDYDSAATYLYLDTTDYTLVLI